MKDRNANLALISQSLGPCNTIYCPNHSSFTLHIPFQPMC